MARRKQPRNKETLQSRMPHEHEQTPAATQQGFLIVGIGASAGGLEALQELFDHMPADTDMGFVVVTHQHPGHTSLLPELLASHSRIPVVEASDGAKVLPNNVYVAPPGVNLAMLNGRLHLMQKTEKRSEGIPLPIDNFLRSLAEDQRERAVCIILSGTGTDGTLGLRAIKAQAGMAMVQDPQSARYNGMPQSAIATGLADYVLKIVDMPNKLLAYGRGPYLIATSEAVPEAPDPADPIQKIFILLRTRIGHDFSSYKLNTIRRRIERRMNVHQIDSPNLYQKFLQENPHEIDILFKELLIRVTSFFRDAEAFGSLMDNALEPLLASRPENYLFRVWIPGCASGEEAYTLAILLREQAQKHSKRLDFQLFATDLDADAIEVARRGLYPDGIAADVSEQRLETYFNREDSSYRVKKEIREMAIFAPQNVIKDPPFTKLDLVCCRNLLIYLNGEVQHRLLPVFHYALKPGGLLMLGPSETVGTASDLFEPLDRKWRIFRRQEVAAGRVLTEIASNSFMPHEEATPRENLSLAPVLASQRQLSTAIERLLLSRFVPPTVVVNERGDIVHIHGRTGQYLEPATGQPRMNVLEMAREGLRMELTSCFRQATLSQGEVLREGVRLKTNGEHLHLDLLVWRIMDPQPLQGLFLVTFRPAGLISEPTKKTGRQGKTQQLPIQEIQRQLQYTRESLKSTIQELERSNEELKSTNEELQSTNEELQSTNEELETSKEELQSLNEELSTVNSELRSKLDELSQANDDMQNLLNSTEVATIFLDKKLRINRFTESARKLINLIQTDVGRPLGDLKSNLKYATLEEDARQVLKTLVFKEAEIETVDGHTYLMRLMPYRTADNVIDGLVATFVNVTKLKETDHSLQLALEAGRMGTWEWDIPGGTLAWSPSYYRLLGWSPTEVQPSFEAWASRVHPDDLPSAQQMLQHAQRQHKDYRHQYRVIWPDQSIHWVMAHGQFLFGEADKAVRMYGVLANIDDLKEAERARELYENILATVSQPLVVLDEALRVVQCNSSFYNLFGLSQNQVEGRLIYELGDQMWNVEPLRRLVEEILPQNTTIESYEFTNDFPTVGRKTLRLNARRLHGRVDRPSMILLAMEDLTERSG